MLAQVAQRVGVGRLPPARLADFEGFAGVEDAFLAVNRTVAQHQVAIGSVEADEFPLGGTVQGIRRPPRHHPLKRVEVMATAIVVSSRRQRSKGGEGRRHHSDYYPFRTHLSKHKDSYSHNWWRLPTPWSIHFHQYWWCFPTPNSLLL